MNFFVQGIATNAPILHSTSDRRPEEDFETILEGELVEVIQGPLQGIIATSIEQQRNYKIIIQFESIGRQFVVHVPRSQVRKIKDKIA